MPVATLDPHATTLAPSDAEVPVGDPVLIVCLSDEDEIETLRTSLAEAR